MEARAAGALAGMKVELSRCQQFRADLVGRVFAGGGGGREVLGDLELPGLGGAAAFTGEAVAGREVGPGAEVADPPGVFPRGLAGVGDPHLRSAHPGRLVAGAQAAFADQQFELRRVRGGAGGGEPRLVFVAADQLDEQVALRIPSFAEAPVAQPAAVSLALDDRAAVRHHGFPHGGPVRVRHRVVGSGGACEQVRRAGDALVGAGVLLEAADREDQGEPGIGPRLLRGDIAGGRAEFDGRHAHQSDRDHRDQDHQEQGD